MKFIIEVHPTHITVSDADECINILEPLLDKYQYEDELKGIKNKYQVIILNQLIYSDSILMKRQIRYT